MAYKRKLLHECSVKELDRELIARGAQIPDEKQFNFRDKEGTPERDNIMTQVKKVYDTALYPDEALSHIITWKLAETLMVKTGKIKKIRLRGTWNENVTMDFYEIRNKKIKKNARCVAIICMKKDLIDDNNGFSTLKYKNYGAAFNLCACEPFNDQPIAAGRLCTGFLVKEDVIATAGHCACEKNVTDLCFVFGYNMLDSSTPVTEIPNKAIYKGVKIINRVYNSRGNGTDWALVKLDRNVVDQPAAKLSKKEIYRDKRVYIIGYPLGLPLKYSPGASVSDISEAHFSADLNVYCGSSGSPVFDSETHEVIGIVVRGDNRDFRWVENCWMSVIYSRADKCSKEPQCTRVSEFIEYCR